MTVYAIQEIDYLENLGLDSRQIFRYVSKKGVSYEVRNYIYLHVILGFRCEGDENCALLGHKETCSNNSSPTFPDNLLPLHAA